MPNDYDELADIFGIGMTPIREIHADDQRESKQYALTLQERVDKIHQSTNISEEVKLSHQESKQTTAIIFSDDSLCDLDDNTIDIKSFLEVKHDDKLKVTPTFKSSKGMQQWMTIVAHHEDRVKDIASKLNVLPMYKELNAKLVQAAKLAPYMKNIHIKDKAQKNLAARTLAVSALEEIIIRELETLAITTEHIECLIDEATEGLWVDLSDNDTLSELLNQMASNRVIINRRFKFDARQTEDLVNIMFSSEPDVRAMSKLNLNSKLSNDVYQEVTQRTALTLEIICAEAMLTQAEVLHLVFPMRGKQHSAGICLTCNTSVKISPATYHKRCKTIKWLEKHCRFKYDDVGQCLTAKRVVYLKPESRRWMIDILRTHAQLKRDIVVQNATETTIWKRTDEGRLKKVPISTRREVDIVGSYAWRQAHGLIRK